MKKEVKALKPHVLIIFLFFTGAAFAQDPLKVAPQAYKLEFENEWVKVMRVHYDPHEKKYWVKRKKRRCFYLLAELAL